MAKLRDLLTHEPPESLSVLFRFRDALCEAGLDDQLEDFLDRADGCGTYDELLRLALEYAETDL
jgi:hypothetical protein